MTGTVLYLERDVEACVQHFRGLLGMTGWITVSDGETFEATLNAIEQSQQPDIRRLGSPPPDADDYAVWFDAFRRALGNYAPNSSALADAEALRTAVQDFRLYRVKCPIARDRQEGLGATVEDQALECIGALSRLLLTDSSMIADLDEFFLALRDIDPRGFGPDPEGAMEPSHPRADRVQRPIIPEVPSASTYERWLGKIHHAMVLRQAGDENWSKPLDEVRTEVLHDKTVMTLKAATRIDEAMEAFVVRLEGARDQVGLRKSEVTVIDEFLTRMRTLRETAIPYLTFESEAEIPMELVSLDRLLDAVSRVDDDAFKYEEEEFRTTLDRLEVQALRLERSPLVAPAVFFLTLIFTLAVLKGWKRFVASD